MQKLYVALGLYAVLALLAWRTMDDDKIRAVTLLLLAFFAVRTLIHHRRNVVEGRDE